MHDRGCIQGYSVVGRHEFHTGPPAESADRTQTEEELEPLAPGL